MEEALRLVNQAMQEAEVQRRNGREGGKEGEMKRVGGKEGGIDRGPTG